MYKVMIIDDEKSLRNLLKNAIQWGELGLEIAGEAASGIEAINIIDEIKPDIAFVDIKMPFMDGIEFSRVAIQRYPDLKIVILTAFSDFEYARECIGIGVCEYLLKPIVRADIKAALEKIIKKLDEERPKKAEKEVTVVPGNDTIRKIEEYIRKNYTQADLNLTSIAQTFGFNASYLSRLFKTETGKNLIDYLTECRMEQAIAYAKQGMLMYMTAKMVGIPDPNYFGKCFKKYTNQTYSDFMKQCKNAT
ncbi:response regulator transcription factor [Defluviitalea raffinosedens]|uniref:response regulator transcription factor n=1 Tax=Defluviitalea raffinosedens TaxID=1450156 RepID=UPI0019571BBD|nr:response regulator [Defluviitalea raffinosedens]MBM7684312.1 YesN/AraC family two-component response regulator [Defluviitalea raffinosedens]